MGIQVIFVSIFCKHRLFKANSPPSQSLVSKNFSHPKTTTTNQPTHRHQPTNQPTVTNQPTNQPTVTNQPTNQQGQVFDPSFFRHQPTDDQKTSTEPSRVFGSEDQKSTARALGMISDGRFFLVGGWTNPFEKYDRQIGSSSPRLGVKIKKFCSYIWVERNEYKMDDLHAINRFNKRWNFSIWRWRKMVGGTQQTHGAFPTKNHHFVFFWGYHHLRKHLYAQNHLTQLQKEKFNRFDP